MIESQESINDTEWLVLTLRSDTREKEYICKELNRQLIITGTENQQLTSQAQGKEHSTSIKDLERRLAVTKPQKQQLTARVQEEEKRLSDTHDRLLTITNEKITLRRQLSKINKRRWTLKVDLDLTKDQLVVAKKVIDQLKTHVRGSQTPFHRYPNLILLSLRVST